MRCARRTQVESGAGQTPKRTIAPRRGQGSPDPSGIHCQVRRPGVRVCWHVAAGRAHVPIQCAAPRSDRPSATIWQPQAPSAWTADGGLRQRDARAADRANADQRIVFGPVGDGAGTAFFRRWADGYSDPAAFLTAAGMSTIRSASFSPSTPAYSMSSKPSPVLRWMLLYIVHGAE
jgi:hypothetical protein